MCSLDAGKWSFQPLNYTDFFESCFRYVCRKVKGSGSKVTGDSSKDPLAEGAVPINVEEVSALKLLLLT